MKTMRTSILMMSLAVTAMAFTSCNKEENETVVDNWNGEIRLSSGVTVQTRANGVPDTQIAAGQKVYAYVDDATTAAPLYQSYKLIAGGDGTFTFADKPMLYPATGNAVNIYAIHRSEALTGAFPTDGIMHQVSTDQSVQHGVNYLQSDLLYAAATGVARSKEAVNLTFYHMLSKVEVVLKSGTGSPDLTGATVTIENTQVQVAFNPSKTAEINTSNSDAEAARAKLLGTPAGDKTSIKIGTMSTNDFSTVNTYASAIVIPQTIAKDNAFIKVKLADDGGELFYKIKEEGGLALKSGKKYQYHITVNLNELTVTSKIEDWEAISVPVTGDAEMEEPVIPAD